MIDKEYMILRVVSDGQILIWVALATAFQKREASDFNVAVMALYRSLQYCG
jgi:hypothetical protein